MHLQLIQFFLVLEVGLLQLKVLIPQLRHQRDIHLVQSADASLVCLDQAILLSFKELFQVGEVHLLKLRLLLATGKDVVQELHQGLRGDVVLIHGLQSVYEI